MRKIEGEKPYVSKKETLLNAKILDHAASIESCKYAVDMGFNL